MMQVKAKVRKTTVRGRKVIMALRNIACAGILLVFSV
jgi:hypothetical protein